MSENLRQPVGDDDLSPSRRLGSDIFALQLPMATECDPEERLRLDDLYVAAIQRARDAGMTDEEIWDVIEFEDLAFRGSFPEY